MRATTMSCMKKKPRNPTRRQLVAWKMQTGQAAVMADDWSTICPRRQGPANPSPDHPRRVGFPGESGFCTCSGCRHFLGLGDLGGYVCDHPEARATAARAMAARLAAQEEERRARQQLALF